jgi:hypothetical protein
MLPNDEVPMVQPALSLPPVTHASSMPHAISRAA